MAPTYQSSSSREVTRETRESNYIDPIGPSYNRSYSHSSAVDPDMYVTVPRKSASAFMAELEEDQKPRMTVIEDQIGRMRRDADALKDSLTKYKPRKYPTPRMTPDEAPRLDHVSKAFAAYYEK
jgi:hypothetical protein